MPGDQYVDPHARQHKTGDAGDVVHPQRHRAHPDRNHRRQSDSAAARRQPSFEHRLVHQNVADQRTIDHFLGLGERAFREGRRWDLAELDVGRLHRRPHREWPGSQDDVLQIGCLGAFLGPPARAVI